MERVEKFIVSYLLQQPCYPFISLASTNCKTIKENNVDSSAFRFDVFFSLARLWYAELWMICRKIQDIYYFEITFFSLLFHSKTQNTLNKYPAHTRFPKLRAEQLRRKNFREWSSWVFGPTKKNSIAGFSMTAWDYEKSQSYIRTEHRWIFLQCVFSISPGK